MDISINEIEPKFDYHQLLLSWFSPNFPIGSYNFSHGLEAAIEMNYIRDIVSLENWIYYLINCVPIQYTQHKNFPIQYSDETQRITSQIRCNK